MRKINFIFLCVFLPLVFGCSWFSKKTTVVAEPAPTPFIQYGKVIDSAALLQGGKMVMVPFQAGAGVVANEDLDKASLMIVKGFAEILSAEDAGLEVVLNEDADQADFIIEGRITDFKSFGSWKKWFGKKKVILGVSGKIKQRGTLKTLVAFSDLEEMDLEKIDFEKISYQVGQNLARFLAAKLKEKE